MLNPDSRPIQPQEIWRPEKHTGSKDHRKLHTALSIGIKGQERLSDHLDSTGHIPQQVQQPPGQNGESGRTDDEYTADYLQ